MFKLFGSKKNDSFFLEIDENSAPAAEAPAAEAPAESAKPEPAKKVRSIKEKAKAAKAEAPQAPAAPAPAVAAPQKTAETVLFASDYLMPAPNSTRRTPGANMSGFLEMAKQYKKR
jgi:hypothetical protein